MAEDTPDYEDYKEHLCDDRVSFLYHQQAVWFDRSPKKERNSKV